MFTANACDSLSGSRRELGVSACCGHDEELPRLYVGSAVWAEYRRSSSAIGRGQALPRGTVVGTAAPLLPGGGLGRRPASALVRYTHFVSFV